LGSAPKYQLWFFLRHDHYLVRACGVANRSKVEPEIGKETFKSMKNGGESGVV
jgi:hypothetical protein